MGLRGIRFTASLLFLLCKCYVVINFTRSVMIDYCWVAFCLLQILQDIRNIDLRKVPY